MIVCPIRLEIAGKLSLIWFGPIPRLLVMDTEMIRDILSNKLGHFEKTRANPLGRFVVTGFISYEQQKWVKHRKIINPAFHLEKLKMMLPAFNTCCNEMVDKWRNLVALRIM
ncbi:Cytochrome p450 [Thalictrum thalictroides]|uniref:Cytochrome p450 n=1 Tax=Thalictrum thalictroides TaxID=46969 RepID=A0A7J6WIU5_THATH|nr:Cytochrome p450 [Thalictrum thalictroides]